MDRFRLGSLLRSGSTRSKAAPEQKKQNRRSFSAFSTLSSARTKDGGTNGTNGTNGSIKPPPSLPDTTTTDSTKVSTSEMVSLAQKITRETEKLEAYMKENGLPLPTFDAASPGDFPKLPADVARSRQEVIYATKELRDLVVGPREGVRWGVWDFLDVLALQAVNHYGIAKLFPVDSTITLPELQAKTPLDAVNLARVLRMAMANHIFREPVPGVIAHTAASRLLAEDDDLQAWVGFNSEDIFPSSAHVLQSLKAHPEATGLTRAGFQFAFDTVDKEPMFATFGKDPARAKRMGRAMASLTGGEGYEVSYLVNVEGGGYDFGHVDQRGGTFVDIGGSHGFVCVDLARRYKKMSFVVQDLPKTVESAPKPISDDEQIAERIRFVAHDFFKDQVVKDADVYFFRWIIHNYSTPYVIQILKALIPALKPGARILINDHCLLEPGQENPWDERLIRRMDMVMLSLLNAQERTEVEYRDVFNQASPSFVFKGVTRPRGCRMSIIEAAWEPVTATEATQSPATEEFATPTEGSFPHGREANGGKEEPAKS